MAQFKNSMDLCKGHLFKQIVVYSMPLLGMMLLQLSFNLADLVIVGRYSENGAESVGAIGSTISLAHLVQNLFLGLSIGTNILAANFFGAKKITQLRRLSYTAITVSMICGLFLASVGQLFIEPLLRLMETNTLAESTLYLRIYFLAMPAYMINVFGSTLLSATGDTKRPLYFLIYSGIFNVVLNYILVVFFGLGVAGVAWATFASLAVAAILVIRALMQHDGVYKFKFKFLSIDFKLLKRMLMLGIPASIQSNSFSFSNVLIQSAVNGLGPAAQAGNAIAYSFEGVVFTGSSVYCQTSVAFVAQNEGGGQRQRTIRSIKYCLLIGFIITSIMGAIFTIWAREFCFIYDSNVTDDIVREALGRIWVTLPLYGICSCMEVFIGSLRGLGSTLSSMVIMLVSVCLVRILWVLFVFPLYNNIPMLIACYPVTWSSCAIISLIYLIYKLKKTRNKCVDFT